MAEGIQLSRREFIVYAASMAAELADTFDYLPAFWHNAAPKPVPNQQTKLYSFDAKIKFLSGLLSFGVIPELKFAIDGNKYYSEFNVFADDKKAKTLHSHVSIGDIVNETLLPRIVRIERSYDYWLLRFTPLYRKDDFKLDFRYKDGKLTEVESRDSYGNDSKPQYDSNGIDILTAILQIFLDLKSGKKVTEGRILLTDKWGGKPVVADLRTGGGSIILEIEEPFDFKKMVIIPDANSEPAKIRIEDLYSLADLEAIRKK